MTSDFRPEPTLRTYLLILRQRKWWVIGVAVLSLSVSLALSFVESKQYSATAHLLVQPSSEAMALGSQLPVTQADVQTELQLVTSAAVKQAVYHELRNQPSVSAAEVAQTNVIAITATSTIPARSALIANAYARAFVAYHRSVTVANLTAAEEQLRAQISSLAKQIKSLQSGANSASAVTALLSQEAVLKEQISQLQVNGAVALGDIELITPAQVPTSPSSPNPTRNGLLGLAAGLILGLGVAFLRDNLDDALSSKEAAEHLGGAPVLGMIPTVTSWKRIGQPLLVSTADPLAPAAEAYRSLRTSLQFARQERDIRTILVTSPAAAEGKTTTLANLGAVFSQAGDRVVLVSCDLRRPRLGGFFDLDEHIGLTAVLLGEVALQDALRPVNDQGSLWVLGSGPIPPNPAELLGGSSAREIFANLRENFDLVLIDSPPILPVTDAAVLSKDTDATLLVVAATQTRQGDLRRAAEKLSQVNAAIVGIVMNEVTKQDGYGYGYGYGSYKPDRAFPSGVQRTNSKASARHANGKTAIQASSFDHHDPA
ncbi:MAG TPA: polysaccharide biosynthesis tyrosine autokinase [Streptosporangiaceae bacterium]|nr:polysaccharide biosynthesis tyrosine autokinase [Streptosporangiaceae bacterium]